MIFRAQAKTVFVIRSKKIDGLVFKNGNNLGSGPHTNFKDDSSKFNDF